MGRPIRYAPNEVRGTLERARHMIAIAPQALADIDAGPKEDFQRFVRREPLGVVLTIAAWNYPYLIAVNSVVPALMAGNAVVLKHSAQTPLCAERFAECFADAGLPDGVFQVLHMSHADTERLDPRSARRLRRVHRLGGGRPCRAARASERFIGTGLELGGCDPAYVRHDANLAHAVENLVDGAYFNSGQSCCGIQRIYVHEKHVRRFRRRLRRADAQVRARQSARARNHARPGGAHGRRRRRSASRSPRASPRAPGPSIDEARVSREHRPARRTCAPQVLLDVDHSHAA